jgi:PEP-CTERM motif
MKRLSYLFACALGLVAGTAWAGPVMYSYNFTPSTTEVFSDSGNSKIMLTNQGSLNAAGPSDIIASQIGVSTTAPDSTPDNFSAKPFSLSLVVTDTASSQSKVLLFNGTFSGNVTKDSSNLTETLTAVSPGPVTLGGNTFDVSIGNFTAPGPGGGLSGSIGFHVAVNGVAPPGGGGGSEPPPTTGVPEPTTMLLSVLGIGGLGIRSWRKRKAVVA